MITIYLKQYNKIIRNADTSLFDELGYDDILWIDMLLPTIKEQKAVENFMESYLQKQGCSLLNGDRYIGEIKPIRLYLVGSINRTVTNTPRCMELNYIWGMFTKDIFSVFCYGNLKCAD